MFFEQRTLVEEHVRLETERVDRIRAKEAEFTNERVKLLIGVLLADEVKHYRLLTTILDQFIRQETMAEADWLNLLWRDAQVST